MSSAEEAEVAAPHPVHPPASPANVPPADAGATDPAARRTGPWSERRTCRRAAGYRVPAGRRSAESRRQAVRPRAAAHSRRTARPHRPHRAPPLPVPHQPRTALRCPEVEGDWQELPLHRVTDHLAAVPPRQAATRPPAVNPHPVATPARETEAHHLVLRRPEAARHCCPAHLRQAADPPPATTPHSAATRPP